MNDMASAHAGTYHVFHDRRENEKIERFVESLVNRKIYCVTSCETKGMLCYFVWVMNFKFVWKNHIKTQLNQSIMFSTSKASSTWGDVSDVRNVAISGAPPYRGELDIVERDHSRRTKKHIWLWPLQKPAHINHFTYTARHKTLLRHRKISLSICKITNHRIILSGCASVVNTNSSSGMSGPRLSSASLSWNSR